MVTEFKKIFDEFLEFMKDEKGLDVSDRYQDTHDLLAGFFKFAASELPDLDSVTEFKKLHDDFVIFMKDDIDIDISERYEDTFEFLAGAFQFLVEKLAELKDEEKDTTITIPNFVEITASYRPGEGKNPGTYNLFFKAGKDLKDIEVEDETKAVITIPGYIDIGIAFDADTKSGSLSFTVGEELKKRIKDDKNA